MVAAARLHQRLKSTFVKKFSHSSVLLCSKTFKKTLILGAFEANREFALSRQNTLFSAFSITMSGENNNVNIHELFRYIPHLQLS